MFSNFALTAELASVNVDTSSSIGHKHDNVSEDTPSKMQKTAGTTVPSVTKTNDDSNVMLERLNEQQRAAVGEVCAGHNVFITGPPGVGKTFLVETIQKVLHARNRIVGVTALTGAAATLLPGGTTLHSFLHLDIGNKDITRLVKEVCARHKHSVVRMRSMHSLIIDEVSMLSAELLERIDVYLGMIRNQRHLRFGGVQMILVGDFCQLPPINGSFCFLSDIWKTAQMKTVVLTQNIRQADDPVFFDVLSRARKGARFMTEDDHQWILSLREAEFAENIVPTRLFARSSQVDEINELRLQELLRKLDSDAKQRATEPCSSSSSSSQSFPCVKMFFPIQSNATTAAEKRKLESMKGVIDQGVLLAVGAQVMVTRNVDQKNGIINGSRGVVLTIDPLLNEVSVQFLNGDIWKIGYMAIKVDDEQEFKPLVVEILPLKLAWAISQHKSQGMTLDAIEVNLGNSVFAGGQAYVALSRARSHTCIRITEYSRNAFRVDDAVLHFYGYT